MNSGFTTFVTKGKIKNIGVHQKLDKLAFKLLPDETKRVLDLKRILHFEGIDGPDGLKVKSSGDIGHLWDPVAKTGLLPEWIDHHFNNLVKALSKGDSVEIGFQAAWMAHYLTDGMTPAHHTDFKKEENHMIKEGATLKRIQKKWLYWGYHGLMSSHVLFETGIAMYLMLTKVKSNFDNELVDEINSLGIKEVFQRETLKIAELKIYEDFMSNGWNPRLIRVIKNRVLTRIPELISATWEAAYKKSVC